MLVSVRLVVLLMPAPGPATLPRATVNEIKVAGAVTLNTRIEFVTRTIRFTAEEPSIVNHFETVSVELAVIIELAGKLKLMVSPAAAATSASRNEPGPLLAVVVTVIVTASGFACARSTTHVAPNTKPNANTMLRHKRRPATRADKIGSVENDRNITLPKNCHKLISPQGQTSPPVGLAIGNDVGAALYAF